MAQPSLVLNPSELTREIKVDESIEINVETDGTGFTCNSLNPDKATAVKNENKVVITGKDVGPASIEIESSSETGEKTKSTVKVNVSAKDTETEEPEVTPEVEVDLSIEPKSVEVEVGKSISVMINTSGAYSMVSESAEVATVDSPRKLIQGAKVGKTSIKVVSTKKGFLDNTQYIEVNVVEKYTGPDIFKNFTPNVKGEVGTEIVLNIKCNRGVHIESSDRSVCNVVDEEAKRVSLNKPGSCVLTVQPVDGEYNEENTIEIPVFVIKKIKEKKMSYTKKEIRDLIISSLTFEQGFIPGKDDDFVICRLDKENVGGKQLIARGVQEAILSVEGFEGSMVEVKIYVQSEYGKMNEKGHHETVDPVERVSFIRFTSGEFNKDDLRELYKDFTEYVRAGYCK